MNIKSIIAHVESLKMAGQQLGLTSKIIYEFGPNRPHIGDDSNATFRGCLGGDDIGSKSGVYIFSDEHGEEILYIGKATKNNLHQRVWSHLDTPTRLPSGWMTFPKCGFKSNTNENAKRAIIDGKAKLHVFTVSQPVETSILEVYLQVMHFKENGTLPCFNKQIG